MDGGIAVEIDYMNYRGERAKRIVIPQRIEFMASEWHPEWQWIMVADEDGKGTRFFAMKDIHSWTQV